MTERIMEPAAIYARKSTDQGGVHEDAKSVTRQVERAKAFAAKRAWTVAPEHIFVDDVVSGAEFESREGLMRLLGALKPKPPFKFLVVMHKDRLGREQLEAGYRLKQLSQAGLRVYEYLEGRECVLDTPIHKFMETVGYFAAEQERYQASLRTRDALARKAEQGHVAGGVTFGYRNEPVFGDALDANGQPKRLYVVRKVHGDESTVVRRIFEMAAAGMGFKKITAILNREGMPSPRPRRSGRPRSWTASSVRGVLMNRIYRGETIWGRTRKRDSWGLKKYLDRPESEWTARHDESLRVVSDELWTAAHGAIACRRANYQRSGKAGGRPTGGVESPYLLTGFAECALCGGGIVVGSRDFRRHRKPVYVCGYHRERGNAVCANRLAVPMEAANAAVVKAIERDLLRPQVVEEAIRQALRALQESGNSVEQRRKALEAELARVEGELARYAEAVAKAGPLDALLAAIKPREARRASLKGQLAGLAGQAKVASLDTARIALNLRERLTDWQGLLQRQIPEARQILRRLLVGRLVFTPQEDERGRHYEFTGQGSISEILAGVVCTDGMVSPAGFEPAFRP